MHPYVTVTVGNWSRPPVEAHVRIYHQGPQPSDLTRIAHHEFFIADGLTEIPEKAAAQWVALSLASVAVAMAEEHGKQFLTDITDTVASVHDT